ncbi:MAG TPA: antibiotic biosynthesis monooxygenase [bacterium]|nr:antibiotic biosynthesis monooxygenase [bacterium]
MIARLWSARATPAGARAYAGHLRTHVLPAVKQVDGYAGAVLLEREVSAAVEILVITWWQSLDAIRRFAGPDPEEAVVADDAAALLTAFDPRVRHYELVVRDEAR